LNALNRVHQIAARKLSSLIARSSFRIRVFLRVASIYRTRKTWKDRVAFSARSIQLGLLNLLFSRAIALRLGYRITF
jgi:hypothetical protein